jgi:hypothetical protein
MPKASDKTFIDKLHGLWKGKSSKYATPRFNTGFLLTHYAGVVEYSTEGWLDKNKDPLNDNVTKLLASSTHGYMAELFADCGEDVVGNPRAGRGASVMKKGAFRTVAQRHKESLGSLMKQLYSTQPHFVRCIIPNEHKAPGKMAVRLVLEQLRCNGVLEGIRICRAGFPNRLLFADLKHRYELLAPPGTIPRGFIDGKSSASLLLEALTLDKSQYRVGCTKAFFKAGVVGGPMRGGLVWCKAVEGGHGVGRWHRDQDAHATSPLHSHPPPHRSIAPHPQHSWHSWRSAGTRSSATSSSASRPSCVASSPASSSAAASASFVPSASFRRMPASTSPCATGPGGGCTTR